MAAGQYQRSAHEHVDNLTAQLAKQSAIADARVASAEQVARSTRQQAADEVGNIRAQTRVQMEAQQTQYQIERSNVEANVHHLLTRPRNPIQARS